MQDLLDLQKKKWEDALETIAYLKQALYCFMDFDPKKPNKSYRKIYDLTFIPCNCENKVFVDKHTFTPWRTFLMNWCKDVAPSFGTNIEEMEEELAQELSEEE